MDMVIKKIKGARARFLKLFKPSVTTLRQVRYRDADFVVFANEDVGWRIISRGVYEGDEIKFLEAFIRPNDLCFDIGGNIGLYSVFMARKANEGRVVTYEPIKVNRAVINLNVTLNGLDNIEVRDFAMSDRTGTLTFSVSRDSAYSSIKPTDRYEEAHSLEVETRTLDWMYSEKNERPDIVKIDVEGAELLVLKGGEGLFSDPKARPRVVLVEICAHNSATYGYRPEDIVNFMESHGYTPYSARDGSLVKGARLSGKTVNVFFLSPEQELQL